ncbi:hypothetical protein QTP88_023852 [Uroleucon formosanum]
MRYIDVCSLYPTVNYYDHYPVGHPEKIFKPKVYDKNWFGLIKCKILPPRNLYHPVLSVKIKMEKSEKLLFPLCYKCAVDQKPSCNHSKNERQFTGTWTTDEVNKALEKGYIITKIYEVWHFEEKSTDLFKDYVDNFMKIKLESSKHNNSSDKEYIKSIFDKMGILLDKYKICDNPGRRAVAKLCLNSLWGKFGQGQKIKKINDRLENINIKLLNDNMIQMCYNNKDYYVENFHNTNILIALFTSSSASLRLYKMLDKLGRAVVYFDTDSIFYIDNGVNKVKTGTMLGEWTDELVQTRKGYLVGTATGIYTSVRSDKITSLLPPFNTTLHINTVVGKRKTTTNSDQNNQQRKTGDPAKAKRIAVDTKRENYCSGRSAAVIFGNTTRRKINSTSEPRIDLPLRLQKGPFQDHYQAIFSVPV